MKTVAHGFLKVKFQVLEMYHRSHYSILCIIFPGHHTSHLSEAQYSLYIIYYVNYLSKLKRLT